MNAYVPSPFTLQKRLFTTADIHRMVEAGIMDEDDNIELIDGEIVVMAAKKSDHEIYKSALNRWLARQASDDLVLGVATTLYLAERLFVEPDLMLYPANFKPEDLRGEDVVLLIEVSDDSLPRDLGAKALIYARHGVGDYWVVDVAKWRIIVHRRPSTDGYGLVETLSERDDVDALLAPGLRTQLAALVAA